MKRLIYVIAACILFSIFAHAKRAIPRALELDPNYFASATIYDADSVTLDEFYGDDWKRGYVTLRSPAIAKGDTLWISFNLIYLIDCTKQDFTTDIKYNFGYNELPGKSVLLIQRSRKWQ